MSFSDDWSKILKLEREKIRPLSPLDKYSWSLRVYLGATSIESDIYHSNLSNWDLYTPQIDNFFPLFKAELKMRLSQIYDLLNDDKEEEAEDLLVALPKYLGELQDAYPY